MHDDSIQLQQNHLDQTAFQVDYELSFDQHVLALMQQLEFIGVGLLQIELVALEDETVPTAGKLVPDFVDL